MTKKKSINLDQFFAAPTPESSDDLAFLLGAAPEETAQAAEERGLPLMYLPTQAIAPDPQQLRHLPHPTELLRLADAGDRAAATIVAGLRELGTSIIERGQIQPVVVYADHDPQQPDITHRLLNGQRRWSAAILHNIPTLWAVEVSRPSNITRLLQQFDENEQREGFSDMERAWALGALKEALQAEASTDVPWSVIEAQLQLSTQRRQDLLRLLRFPPAAQATIMRHGWSEWTLRPLHMAINSHELSAPEAMDMLQVLAEADEVNATVVAALVDGYRMQRQQQTKHEAHSVAEQSTSSRHNGKNAIAQRMSRIRNNVDQLRMQLAAAPNHAERAVWQAEARRLRDSLQALLSDLD